MEHAASPDGKGPGGDGDAASVKGPLATALPTSRHRPSAAIHDPDPKNWAPHKYTRIDNSSEAFIKELLEYVEPVTYSKAACGVLRGKKEDKMTTLCEHFEFTTG
eukprot:1365127-Pyramimonas_sp.AAC.1